MPVEVTIFGFVKLFVMSGDKLSFAHANSWSFFPDLDHILKFKETLGFKVACYSFFLQCMVN